MPNIVFIGAYAYAQRVLDALPDPPALVITDTSPAPRLEELYWDSRAAYLDLAGRTLSYTGLMATVKPDLVVVAGWRKMVPVIAPTVGFHSAKLPEYPGRAPVPNAILRGDRTLTNTMLWLDDDIDSGPIIDEWEFPIVGRDADDIYREIGETSALMLKRHYQGLLDGSAPRRPQDISKRGPLTPADAWQKL